MLDELYNFIFVKPALWLAGLFWKIGDMILIDGFINGIAARSLDVTGKVKSMQSGYVYHYAFVMMIGLTALITWFII